MVSGNADAKCASTRQTHQKVSRKVLHTALSLAGNCSKRLWACRKVLQTAPSGLGSCRTLLPKHPDMPEVRAPQLARA
eukprot:3065591-Alexandrium_andersonii.AAC.1